MADEEIAAWFETGGKTLDKRLMRGTVKVEHHIATEDGGKAEGG